MALAVSWWAHAQSSEPVSDTTSASTPVVTLGSPMLRTTADHMNMPWLLSGSIPDFRLKMNRPEWGEVSVTGLEDRIRGFEIRLPLNGVWVGYELPNKDERPGKDELPRATFSIQRDF